MRLPEGGHRRQRMKNIAHGPQPDHKQAKLGSRVQTLIFSHRQVRQIAQLASATVFRSRSEPSRIAQGETLGVHRFPRCDAP
jgi:hypothetical protein